MKNITELILKFMENLDFKEKCSPHTIVAYGCDLQQSFQKYLPGDLHGPGINGAENYIFASTEDTPEPLPCPLHTKDLEAIVRTYIHSIRSLEPASRARKVATLRRFFSFLKTENIVDEMPRLLTTPKAVQKLPHFLSVDEALTILKLFSKNELNTRELNSKILFLLLYGVGLRVSEACNLEWQQINLTKRELRIKGKGNKERIISMPQLVQLNLATLRSSQNKKYIWGDKPLLTRTAYNYIVLIGKRAQLTKPIHPHALRHSYATHLMNDGADLRVIQELLGHASLVATEKYTHVSMDQLSRTMESFHPLSKKVV